LESIGEALRQRKVVRIAPLFSDGARYRGWG
jgi:hypothetical protein